VSRGISPGTQSLPFETGIGLRLLTRLSLAESVSFLPISLLIQSFCWLFPPPVEVIPGTTSGMVNQANNVEYCVVAVGQDLKLIIFAYKQEVG